MAGSVSSTHDHHAFLADVNGGSKASENIIAAYHAQASQYFAVPDETATTFSASSDQRHFGSDLYTTLLPGVWDTVGQDGYGQHPCPPMFGAFGSPSQVSNIPSSATLHAGNEWTSPPPEVPVGNFGRPMYVRPLHDQTTFQPSSNGVIDYSSNTVPAVPAILPTPYWPGNVSSYGGSESARLSTLASTLPTATSNELTQAVCHSHRIRDLGVDVPLRRSTLSLHGRNQAAVERRRIHPAILSCSRCPWLDFTSQRSLNTHILVSHFRMRLPCPINECEKEFHHENALRRHLRAQHYSAIAHFMGRLLPSDTTTASQDPASAICLGCHVRVVFQTKPDLENHIMRKHLDTRFPCPFVGCGDWYSEVPSLRQHMRETHDDVMNLKCYTVRQPERVLDG